MWDGSKSGDDNDKMKALTPLVSSSSAWFMLNIFSMTFVLWSGLFHVIICQEKCIRQLLSVCD